MKPNLKLIKTIAITAAITAWVMLPADKKIIFLIDHVINIENLFTGLLVLIVVLLIRMRSAKRRQESLKEFTNDVLPGQSIAESFRAKNKRIM